jgi:hypothetical protein
MASRVMKLRRNDACCVCGGAVGAGTNAYWNKLQRTVTCLDCLGPAHGGGDPRTIAAAAELEEIARGRPGESAAREHRRRRADREARVRSRHPLIGGLLLALAPEPRHEAAWALGAHGEQVVARRLERRTAGGPAILLHDRQMPGGCGNIDHLAIAPRGVFVIDAKAIRGKVRVSRPLLGEPRLLVKGRGRPRVVAGLDRQVGAVRAALSRRGYGEAPINGVLCFTKAELPLFGSAEIHGHRLCGARSLARELNRRGELSGSHIDAIARELATSFPPA